MLSVSHDDDCEVRVRMDPERAGEMTLAFTLFASYSHNSLSSYISTSMNVLHPFCSRSKRIQSELFMHSILSASSGSRCE
jgi:hypothetical protein